MNDLIKNPVLGAICGDMIGVPYEFLRSGAMVEKDFPLWKDDSKFSDDTVMTLAVAKWLLDRPLNTNNLVKIMQELGRKYRNCGFGGMFGIWIDSDNPQPYGSWGNGSAMRVAPVGCVFNTLETTLIIAEESASVSHNHPEGIEGTKAVAECVFKCLNDIGGDLEYGYTTKELLPYHLEKYNYNLKRTPQEIRDSGYTFEVGCQKSVPEAICCFLNSNSYEETIREAILLRGDTDTQAAIAGSIAAAYWGIPVDVADECLDRLPLDLYNILEDFSTEYDLELQ